MSHRTIIPILLLTCATLARGAEPECRQTPVFVGKEGGYDTYRIPALVVTKKGTALAFCEGRKKGASDTGDIDLLLKRSTDGGATWGEQQVVWDDAGNTCGNPCPVVDLETGTIWLLLTWNRGDDHESQIIAQKSKDTRRVFITSSQDDGATWAKPREITADVKKPDWTWYATGPCNGIQLMRGANKGRLVIPCDHIEAGTKKYFSHAIYSDDHGQTWKLGGSSPADHVNECSVVELSDGRLMLNMRNYDRGKTCRQVCFSGDGGLAWTDQRFDAALIEPICQASILRYSWPDETSKGRIVFSNPASRKRDTMTVRLSEDDGQTWSASKALHAGPAAYSCLAALGDGRVACLYERGEKNAYQQIAIAIFPLSWLTR